MNYVLADIHGDSEAFNRILSLIQMKEDDHLYILGDVVDRGPDRLWVRVSAIRRTARVFEVGRHDGVLFGGGCRDSGRSRGMAC